MKIIVAGGGKIGSTLTAQLAEEGHELTVIDNDTDVLENLMQQYDVIGVQGNAASMEVLEAAGVREANLLIAATDADEVNLLSCMTGHGMNHELHTIGRIRSPEYRTQAFSMRDLFALNMIINPEKQAAEEIARLLKFPGFLKMDTFAKGHVEIVELRIDEHVKVLHNIRLMKLGNIVHTQVLVCAVLRDGEVIMPDGNFIIKEGDLIFVIGTPENLNAMLMNLKIITEEVNRVMIAGGGRISYYLCKELEKTGVDCTILEQNHDRCEELAAKLPNATIVEGDASRQDFLDSEGIGHNDALVTLTGLDELNIVIALYGHARNVTQIVTKLSHAENNRILDSMPIGSVISPKELASNNIVRYVRAMQNKQGAAITVHMIAGGRAEAVEFVVDRNTRHCGESLKNLKTKSNVLIVGISHRGKTEIPSGNSKFEIGDNVVVVTNGKSKILQLNDIFED